MMPAARCQRFSRFDAQRVVEPALHEVELQPSADEPKLIAFSFRYIRHPRDDRSAAVFFNANPGGEREFVVEAKIAGLLNLQPGAFIKSSGFTKAAINEVTRSVLQRNFTLRFFRELVIKWQ